MSRAKSKSVKKTSDDDYYSPTSSDNSDSGNNNLSSQKSTTSKIATKPSSSQPARKSGDTGPLNFVQQYWANTCPVCGSICARPPPQ